MDVGALAGYPTVGTGCVVKIYIRPWGATRDARDGELTGTTSVAVGTRDTHNPGEMCRILARCTGLREL